MSRVFIIADTVLTVSIGSHETIFVLFVNLRTHFSEMY